MVQKKENSFELRRQIFHICLGLAILFLFYYGILTPFRMLIIILVGVAISLISRKYKIPFVYWFLKTFERKKELEIFPGRGTIFFLVGCALAMRLFPFDVALAAIVILTLGDSISHLVGRYLGALKSPLSKYKFLEGTAAGTLFAFAGAVFFVSPLEAFVASLIAMLAENIEKQPIDDNIIVPLVAGTVILLLRVYL